MSLEKNAVSKIENRTTIAEPVRNLADLSPAEMEAVAGGAYDAWRVAGIAGPLSEVRLAMAPEYTRTIGR